MDDCFTKGPLSQTKQQWFVELEEYRNGWSMRWWIDAVVDRCGGSMRWWIDAVDRCGGGSMRWIDAVVGRCGGSMWLMEAVDRCGWSKQWIDAADRSSGWSKQRIGRSLPKKIVSAEKRPPIWNDSIVHHGQEKGPDDGKSVAFWSFTKWRFLDFSLSPGKISIAELKDNLPRGVKLFA